MNEKNRLKLIEIQAEAIDYLLSNNKEENKKHLPIKKYSSGKCRQGGSYVECPVYMDKKETKDFVQKINSEEYQDTLFQRKELKDKEKELIAALSIDFAEKKGDMSEIFVTEKANCIQIATEIDEALSHSHKHKQKTKNKELFYKKINFSVKKAIGESIRVWDTFSSSVSIDFMVKELINIFNIDVNVFAVSSSEVTKEINIQPNIKDILNYVSIFFNNLQKQINKNLPLIHSEETFAEAVISSVFMLSRMASINAAFSSISLYLSGVLVLVKEKASDKYLSALEGLGQLCFLKKIELFLKEVFREDFCSKISFINEIQKIKKDNRKDREDSEKTISRMSFKQNLLKLLPVVLFEFFRGTLFEKDSFLSNFKEKTIDIFSSSQDKDNADVPVSKNGLNSTYELLTLSERAYETNPDLTFVKIHESSRMFALKYRENKEQIYENFYLSFLKEKTKKNLSIEYRTLEKFFKNLKNKNDFKDIFKIRDAASYFILNEEFLPISGNVNFLEILEGTAKRIEMGRFQSLMLNFEKKSSDKDVKEAEIKIAVKLMYLGLDLEENILNELLKNNE